MCTRRAYTINPPATLEQLKKRRTSHGWEVIANPPFLLFSVVLEVTPNQGDAMARGKDARLTSALSAMVRGAGPSHPDKLAMPCPHHRPRAWRRALQLFAADWPSVGAFVHTDISLLPDKPPTLGG